MLVSHLGHSVCKFRNRYLIVTGGLYKDLKTFTELYDTETDKPWIAMGKLND